MRRLLVSMVVVIGLAGCWGDNAYIVEGTVLERTSPTEVVIQHEDIPGFMDAMTMPFHVREPSVLHDVEPGDRILARLIVEERQSWLVKVRVVGQGKIPSEYQNIGAGPARVGVVFARTDLPLTDGTVLRIGEGQRRPAVVTFLYTRCPIPEFCPAVVTRLQGLQASLDDDADIVAVTLDPDFDTMEVLRAFGNDVGARSPVWRFARLQGQALEELANRAGLAILRQPGTPVEGAVPEEQAQTEILHGLRLLVLDASGTLVERYDDNGWPLERVLSQLRTGLPSAPEGSSGTLTPATP